MATINKPSQPLTPAADIEEVEGLIDDAIAADTSHAPLVENLVPAENLPSYVDDVLEFESLDEFPEEGETGKIYVALDTNSTYRWSGSTYIQVGGVSLGEGDGITIENDLVSVDMNYVEENLEGFEPTINDLAEIRSNAAAGATAVQPAALAAKQDTLVSGTNIKTINGNSLLGSGNIEIAASGIINFVPIAEQQDYQILDGFYTQPLVTAIKYQNMLYPLVYNNYPQGTTALENGDNSCSIFLGAAELIAESAGDFELFVLCYYKLLAHVHVEITVETDPETGDQRVGIGSVQVPGLTDNALAELRQSIEYSLMSTFALNGGASDDSDTEFSLAGMKSMIKGCFGDPEVIKKLIYEPEE